MQPQLQYHAPQVHYQNGTQIHYAVQPPPPPPPPQHQPHFEQNAEIPDHLKGQGLKRRFSDVDGTPVNAVSSTFKEIVVQHRTKNTLFF